MNYKHYTKGDVMKRFFPLGLFFLLAAGLIFALGCSDDDDDGGPTLPVQGDISDTNFVLFWNEFEGMDGTTGGMFGAALGFIGEIFEMQPAKVASPMIAVYEYHQASGYWYCIDTVMNGDVTLAIVDSLLFKQGNDTVQYPVENLVTEIVSYLTLTAMSDFIDSGLATMNTVIVPVSIGSDTLRASGSGNFVTAYSNGDTTLTDTTTCTVETDFSSTYTNIAFIPDSLGVGGCPFGGTINYTGTMEIGCTGTENDSISGNWSVKQVFNDDIMTYTITHGNTVWTVIDTCTTN
jgi:hypothetical protein